MMDQTQQMPRAPAMPSQPAQQPMAQEQPAEKKGGWFKWLMIILAILIIGGAVAYFFVF